MPEGSACRDVAPSRARDEIADAPRAVRGAFLRGLGLRGLVQGGRRGKGVASMVVEVGGGVGSAVGDGC